MRIDKARRPSTTLTRYLQLQDKIIDVKNKLATELTIARNGTYLCCSILRCALRLRQLALSALAPIAQVVATALCARTHHSSWSAYRRVDVVVVGTCAA
jgi:hypothetical protein